MPSTLVSGHTHVPARQATSALPGPAGLPAASAVRYTRALLSTPYGRVHLQPLACVETRTQEIVATALLHVTRAFVFGVPTLVGLVQDTATAARPGAGLSELMAHLIEQAPVLAPDVSLFMISAPEATSLPGFVALPTRDLVLTIKPGRRSGAPMLPIRSGDHSDLAAIAALPQLHGPEVGLRLERSPEALAFAITRQRLLAGLSPEGTRELRFFVVEEGMRAVAYVVVTATAGGWTLEECGDRDRSGARVGATLQALAALTPGQPNVTLTAWLPPGFLPPQVEITAVRPSSTRLFARTRDSTLDLGRLRPEDICYWHGDL